jgi:hypothetical protein
MHTTTGVASAIRPSSSRSAFQAWRRCSAGSTGSTRRLRGALATASTRASTGNRRRNACTLRGSSRARARGDWRCRCRLSASTTPSTPLYGTDSRSKQRPRNTIAPLSIEAASTKRVASADLPMPEGPVRRTTHGSPRAVSSSVSRSTSSSSSRPTNGASWRTPEGRPTPGASGESDCARGLGGRSLCACSAAQISSRLGRSWGRQASRARHSASRSAGTRHRRLGGTGAPSCLDCRMSVSEPSNGRRPVNTS